jgi:hypothetical protein
LILLGASIWYAVSQPGSTNWPALAEVDPWLIAGLAFTVFLSTIFFPGLLFWLVTRPFVTTRQLDLFTMQGLIAGSALLNYTPVKAGLIGRVAYLKHFHGVGLRAAIVTHAMVVSIFLVTCTVAFFLTAWRPEFGLLWGVSIFGSFSVLTIVGAPLLGLLIPANVAADPRIRDSRFAQMIFLALCFAMQILALVATTVRWWLVFLIMDKPMSLADSWLAALVHMVTVMGGPANGLGFREWVIGFAVQRGFFGMQTDLDLGAGVAASLVDRGVEVVVLVPLGLLGLILLRRGRKAGDAVVVGGSATD